MNAAADILAPVHPPGADDAPRDSDALVRRHAPMVYACARREVRDPHAADDVTQAVFILLMRRANDIPPEASLAGWLFTATRYVAADARKQATRRTRHEREAAAMPRPTPIAGDNATRAGALLTTRSRRCRASTAMPS